MEQIILNWIIQHSFDQYLQSLVAIAIAFVGTNWVSLSVLIMVLRFIAKRTKWKWDDNLVDALEKAIGGLRRRKPIILNKKT